MPNKAVGTEKQELLKPLKLYKKIVDKLLEVGNK